MERILCAAIRRVNRRNYNPYYEGTNDIINIEIGYRHHDIFSRFGEEVSNDPNDQGFYTSYGRYVDRYEGMKIAIDAGQVPQSRGLETPGFEAPQYYPLYSENLY